MARVEPADAQAHVNIELLKDEQGGLMYETGITTISFFKGDFKPAADALRTQFASVVDANPWLAGRLVKVRGGTGLRHPAAPSAADVDAMFSATAAADAAAFKLTPSEPYPEICSKMYRSNKVIVANGSTLVNQSLPTTLLTVAESAPGDFAVIFSISHATVDGHTYYDIFKMLQPGAAVRALTSARVLSFSETMRDELNQRKELEWADSPSATCMFMCSMMFVKKAKCFAFHVDPERVSAAKSAAAESGQVAFVSTNDILTSAFFTECRTRIGMMGIDCRDRIKGIGSDLAGNYVSVLTMDPETYGTPVSIRKMLSSPPYTTTTKPLPGCCDWFCGRDSGKAAMVTNWCGCA
jgi:hypothetical protein